MIHFPVIHPRHRNSRNALPVTIKSERPAGLADLPQLDYWIVITITAIATILLCAATYRWIEFPFLSISHKKPKQACALLTPTVDLV